MLNEKHLTNSDEETVALGKKFAELLERGDVVAINGDLGSGKTEFVKGVCSFFEVEEIVTSPTFTIINQYSGKLDDSEISIYHIDLYRINSKEELAEIGFNECVYSPDSVKLIEWPQKALDSLPAYRFRVIIETNDANENERLVTIGKDLR